MKKFFDLTPKGIALSVQHLFAMFGATVLVPILTGMSISVALLTAGIGTLIFHLVTKLKVPVFLGSSFAFIPVIIAAQSYAPAGESGIPYAQGGIIIAGLLYLVFALVVYLVGVERIKRVFPPEVTGPVIIVIGLGLAFSAMNNVLGLKLIDGQYVASGLDLLIALFTMIVVIVGMVFAKGFFKLVPILIGIVSGYALCLILHLFGVYDMSAAFAHVAAAPWINVPYVTEGFMSLPKFNWNAILAIAPVALVTFMEHLGDITTNSKVVGKDFMKDPGLHRTLIGDGLATAVAGFFGGPANTTYSENTGVLATTKNYDPRVLRGTAVIAIFLAFFGKFGAFLAALPTPVIGGVSLILYGMIAAIGIRTLSESKLDFTDSRNLVIVSLVLATGIGLTVATYNPATMSVGGLLVKIGAVHINISPLFAATILGIVANLVLPKKIEKDDEPTDAAVEQTADTATTDSQTQTTETVAEPIVEPVVETAAVDNVDKVTKTHKNKK